MCIYRYYILRSTNYQVQTVQKFAPFISIRIYLYIYIYKHTYICTELFIPNFSRQLTPKTPYSTKPF